MKKVFYIAEMQNPQSYCKAEKVLAKSLTSAKALASKMQVFQGTTLAIGYEIDDNGFITDVVCKKVNGKWC